MSTPVDRPALRLFFSVLLHDGALPTAEVRSAFASSATYYRSVYAMSREGFIRSVRDGKQRKWDLAIRRAHQGRP